MPKRKRNSDNTYYIWLESARKLDPPYDYFAFADLANSTKAVTNSGYHNLMLKALSKSNMSTINDILHAIKVYKVNQNMTYNSSQMKLRPLLAEKYIRQQL
jgi:hypothetical protein